MKGFGIFLVVAGLMWALIAFNMNTTVTSESQRFGSGEYAIDVPAVTVNNLGLMETRRNHLMFSGLTILAGVVLIGFGSISSQPKTDGLRACPSCAELIQPAAKICRFCNAQLPQDFGDKPAAIQSANFDATSASDYELMKHFEITHQDNKYHYGSYQFDTLRRAVAHAQHSRSLQRNV